HTPLLALLAVLGTCGAARANLAVHGIDHAPLGAAVLSQSVASDGSKLLNVTSVGSSGLDGVTFKIALSGGVSIRGNAGSAPIALRATKFVPRIVVGGVLTPVAALWQKVDNSDLVVSAQMPGAPPVSIEVWNDGTLTYSDTALPATTEARFIDSAF